MYNKNTQEDTSVCRRQLNWWKLAALERRTCYGKAASRWFDSRTGDVSLCIWEKH